MDAVVERAEVDLGPLDGSVGFLLRLAQLRSFETFRERLGEIGLHPGAFSVLVLIAENPGVRQGAVADRLMIKRAHMTKLVRALEEDGLVLRLIPDHDRRSVELTLTEAGRAYLDEFAPDVTASEKEAARALSDAETAELVRLLRKYLGLGGTA
jgi:DNA-binding MarR family transcriptional regulator